MKRAVCRAAICTVIVLAPVSALAQSQVVTFAPGAALTAAQFNSMQYGLVANANGSSQNQTLTMPTISVGSASSIDLSSAVATSASGVSARTLADRFSEHLNVKDFGAQGDGVTDDTAAVEAAVTKAMSLLANGISVEIDFPPGKYKKSSPIVAEIRASSNTNFAVIGALGMTTISDTGAHDGIDVTYSAFGGTFRVSDLRFDKSMSASPGGDAIKVHSQNQAIAHGIISDIYCDNIGSDGSTSRPFQSCLHLQNVIRSDIEHISNLNAGTGNAAWNAGTALWLDGTDGLYTVDNHATDIQVLGGFAAVALTGHVEGFQVDKITDLYTAYGVYAPGRSWLLTADGNNAAMYPNTTLLWVTVRDSHLNTYFRGAYFVSGGSINVYGNLLYNAFNSARSGDGQSMTPAPGAYLPVSTNELAGSATAYSYSGSDMVNCSWCVVNDNEVHAATATNSTGILASHIGYDSTDDGDQSSLRASTISGNSVVNTSLRSITLSGLYGAKVSHNRLGNGLSAPLASNPHSVFIDNDGVDDTIGITGNVFLLASGYNQKIAGGYIQIVAGSVPPCTAALVGSIEQMSSSDTNWGDTVNTTGTQSPVLGYCNGSNWTVMAR
ncbi:glycoside hydrolase family 55 protein [Novacetimonas pomaceti]|uniref:glycoside hydrolase family 55 protein n=1 Tax=Novacetimonas pomaceti TaxID=2021998 RepID=UPI001C2D0EAC|nr:glycoside hydrolase family 55 protein [Novacetimonas pomaceti]MBV1835425.1 glycoside hydrolase family 55 protein [Novacetimonas pomaceti]